MQILMLVVLFAIFGAYSLQFHAFAADEYTYMNNAKAFASGELDKASDLGRFPMFSFVLSIAYKILGDAEATGRALNVFIGFCTALAVLFMVYWNQKNKEVAFIAASLTAANPALLFLASRTFSEPLFILLLVLCAWALLLALKNEKWFVVLGVLLVSLILTRFVGLYFAVIAVAFFVIKRQIVQIVQRKWLYAGIAAGALFAFLLVLQIPNASNNFATFIQDQISGNLALASGNTIGLGLPDKISSYLLVTPFLLGAPLLVLVWFAFKDRKKLIQAIKTAFSSDLFLLSAISIVLIAIIMELHGFIAPRLLRYAAVVIPFLAILFAMIVTKFTSIDTEKLARKIMYALIMLNLVVGFAVVGYFGSYEKHVAFREAALYTKDNCNSFQSNIDYVLLYYTGQKNSVESKPECFVLNNYDGLTDKPPSESGYASVYQYGKVTVYKR